MKIEVEYKNNKIQNRTYSMSMLAFAKHLAMAGQGYAPNINKLTRVFGMFLHYSPFMNLADFNNGFFSTPSPLFYDPTEKSHFSNLAGKAIADFLSKKIDSSIYTVNYEAVMKLKRMPIKGERPDLIAFTSNKKTFAIEVKGFSGNSGNMLKHKQQSQKGGIPVDFSVACVSHGLYKNVKCKYYDPENKMVKYDENLMKLLTKSYYSNLEKFLEIGTRETIEVQKEKFYKIDLLNNSLINQLSFFKNFSYITSVYLILPLRIREYAEKGLSTSMEPFTLEKNRYGDNLYIDNDRVGILIE